MSRMPYRLERPVLDTAPLLPLCEAVGLPPPAKPHVTIAWSKTPIDWDDPVALALSDSIEVELLRPRMLVFGSSSPLWVLAFDSALFSARHQALVGVGATWAHAAYQPHVTLGPKLGLIPDVRLSLPTRLRFGPERRKLP